MYCDWLVSAIDLTLSLDQKRLILFFLGQQARDALLLIMQLSHRNESIAKYIIENTNFCPVSIISWTLNFTHE